MIRNFLDERFPEDISYGSTGGPQYSTDIIATTSGHEKRNINWLNSRNTYNIIHGVKTKEQMSTLISFFRNCYGKALGFRFKDWCDYECIEEEIGIGDGKTSEFQLIKSYKTSDSCVKRKITKPVIGSVSIFLSETPKLRGTETKLKPIQDVKINHTTGVVTFNTTPEIDKIVYASFEFDVPARFNTDTLNASIDDYGIHSWKDISIIELKE